MSKSKEDALFSTVNWVPTGLTEPGVDGIPVATHEGVLSIGDASFTVYQLSNGQRIIKADDIMNFFGLIPDDYASEG